jgi:hypothetical protein
MTKDERWKDERWNEDRRLRLLLTDLLEAISKIIPSPSRGGLGWGWVWRFHTTPIPTFPLRGKEIAFLRWPLLKFGVGEE